MNTRLFLTILATTVLTVSKAASGISAPDSTTRVSTLPPDTVETATILPAEKSASQASERKPFLPTRRRIDREINKIKYVYKGEMAVGIAASYGTLTSDDTDLLLIIDNIKLDGSIFTLNPSFGYFLKDNLCLGLRFGYTRTDGHLDNAALNLGEANDVNISFANLSLSSHVSSWGIFMRSYAGIDPKGHFGLFSEIETALKYGSSKFAYESNGELKHTNSNSQQFKVSFSGGVAVYLFPNICSTISCSLGGIQFNNITQKNEKGEIIGSRKVSKMRFRLNLLGIQVGVNIHL